MKYLIILLMLTGCATLNTQDQALLNHLQTVANQKVAAFNILRHANMTAPVVEFASVSGDYAEAVPGVIFINPVLCEQDMDDCINDTIPHELAHEAIYQFTKPVQNLKLENGHVVQHLYYRAHDGIWCDTMKAFGGNPQKHGYCLN